MIMWIAANAATIVVSGVILGLMLLAGRSVYKHKGGCSCSGCSGQCSHCSGCGSQKEI